jgi:intein/homing endonuclease
MPISKRVNKDFFKKWSTEMAYVLGFFTADGNLTVNHRNGHYIEFTSCDRAIIWDIRKSLNSDYKISERTGRKNDWNKYYRLQIGCREIFNDLEELGMKTRKSNDLEFPKVPMQYLGDFLRGYFDGDGCVSFGRYFRKQRRKYHWLLTSRFISGSKNFLLELKRILSKHLKGGSLSKKNRGYQLLYGKDDSIDLYKLMYNNISSDLFLKRKYNIFRKVFKILKINAGVEKSGVLGSLSRTRSWVRIPSPAPG